MISLACVIIYCLISRGCMAAPRWRHIGKNVGYRRSVAAVEVEAVVKAVVAGCVTAVKLVEEVDNTEEAEEVSDRLR